MNLIADFKLNDGKTFGVVTAYCKGRTLCPSWINNPLKL